jgi:hypothetical protein
VGVAHQGLVKSRELSVDVVGSLAQDALEHSLPRQAALDIAQQGIAVKLELTIMTPS